MVQENPYQSPLEECKSYDSTAIDSPDRSLACLLFSFKGRIRRQTFWIVAVGVQLLVGIAFLFFLDKFGFQSRGALKDAFGAFLMLLLFVSWVWVSLAIRAKRWHDRDKSPFWICINFIPWMGQIWEGIELGFFRGTEGPNRYGPDPTGDIRGQSINQLRENLPIRGKAIELDGTDTTDSNLARLADGWEIEELRLGGTRVTDEGMKLIGKLSNLKLLDLSLTAVSDAGLECLLNLTKLSEIWLGGTRLTDAGLLKLSTLPRLTRIYAMNTSITQDGVTELQSRLPQCEIYH